MLLSLDEKSKLMELALQESNPFEAIELQFGLSAGQVSNLMNKYLSSNSYKRWHDEVTGIATAH